MVERVSTILANSYGFSRDAAHRAAATFGDAWVREFGELITTLFADQNHLSAALEGYGRFAFDSLRRQKRFEKERQYDSKSFVQAAQDVYFNEQHMLEQYLPGLLLSHYFWPHHYRQLHYFKDFFVSAVPTTEAIQFTEVGVGTGIYSRLLLQHRPQATGLGFDISSAAKTFAEHHLQAYGLHKRYRIELQDICTDSPAEPFQWLICVEVLEHLEDPVFFLKSLRTMLQKGGKAFITAALNAPNEDHIYLYETAEQILEHLNSAGFSLEQYFYASAYQAEHPDLPVPSVAAFIVT